MCCVLLTVRESQKQGLFNVSLSNLGPHSHPCSAGTFCHRQAAFICSLGINFTFNFFQANMGIIVVTERHFFSRPETQA